MSRCEVWAVDELPGEARLIRRLGRLPLEVGPKAWDQAWHRWGAALRAGEVLAVVQPLNRALRRGMKV